MKVCAIIMAAGSGKRMGGSVKKQFMKLNDREIIKITTGVFENCPQIDEIVAVTGKDEVEYVRELLGEFKKISAVVVGGSERQYSVYNGLKAAQGCDIVLIHDGVRPFVTEKDIVRCIEKTKEVGACVLGVPAKDTIKLCDSDGVINSTPDRKLLWYAQTPQCFKYKLIMEAYKKSEEEQYLGTDDASLLERMGAKVEMVMGSYDNIKITTPEDIVMGKAILDKKSEKT